MTPWCESGALHLLACPLHRPVDRAGQPPSENFFRAIPGNSENTCFLVVKDLLNPRCRNMCLSLMWKEFGFLWGEHLQLEKQEQKWAPPRTASRSSGARLLNTSGKKTNLTQPKTKVFKALGISLPWHYEWTRRRKVLSRDKATIKELQRRLRQIGNDKSATCMPRCQALGLSLLIPKQNILLVTCFT